MVEEDEGVTVLQAGQGVMVEAIRDPSVGVDIAGVDAHVVKVACGQGRIVQRGQSVEGLGRFQNKSIVTSTGNRKCGVVQPIN